MTELCRLSRTLEIAPMGANESRNYNSSLKITFNNERG